MPLWTLKFNVQLEQGILLGIQTFTLSLKLDIQKISILIMLLMFFLGF